MQVTFDSAICAVMDAEARVAYALFVSKEVLTNRFLLTFHVRLVAFRDMLRVTHFDDDYSPEQASECFAMIVACHQLGLAKTNIPDEFEMPTWVKLSQDIYAFCKYMDDTVQWTMRKRVLNL